MRKTLLIFLSVIVGFYVVLSSLDKSEYATEKQLWRIQKHFTQIARDPSVVPDQRFENVVQEYRAVIQKYPNSPLTPRVYLPIGKLYLLKKDYPKAREAFMEVLKKYPQNEPVAAEALLNIGNAYEEEKNEAEAVKTYKKIIQAYPLSEVGINMPLYIANYYFSSNKQTEGQQALQDAAVFYKKIAKEHPQTNSGFDALRMLVTVYMAQAQWEAAVNTLEKILMDFATSESLTPQRADTLLKTINTVSAAHLKSYDIPIGIYKKFINRYPNHPLNKTLLSMSKALETLKEKGVVVSTQKPQ